MKNIWFIYSKTWFSLNNKIKEKQMNSEIQFTFVDDNSYFNCGDYSAPSQEYTPECSLFFNNSGFNEEIEEFTREKTDCTPTASDRKLSSVDGEESMNEDDWPTEGVDLNALVANIVDFKVDIDNQNNQWSQVNEKKRQKKADWQIRILEDYFKSHSEWDADLKKEIAFQIHKDVKTVTKWYSSRKIKGEKRRAKKRGSKTSTEASELSFYN